MNSDESFSPPIESNTLPNNQTTAQLATIIDQQPPGGDESTLRLAETSGDPTVSRTATARRRHSNHTAQLQAAQWLQRARRQSTREQVLLREHQHQQQEALYRHLYHQQYYQQAFQRQVIERQFLLQQQEWRQLLQQQFATSQAMTSELRQSRAQQEGSQHAGVQQPGTQQAGGHAANPSFASTRTPIYLTLDRHWSAQVHDRHGNVRTVPGPGLFTIGSGVRFRNPFGAESTIVAASHQEFTWSMETSGLAVIIRERASDTEG